LKRTTLCILAVFLCAASTQPDRRWEIAFTSPDKALSRNAVTPERMLVRVIRGCVSTFCGAFYDLSSMNVCKELVAAANRGVDVRLVTDDDNFSGDCVTMLLEAGIPVVHDEGAGLMHNKFAVIDGETVFTGSYNTTDNGETRNNNNALVFHSREMAEIYLAEFDEMFSEGIFGNRRESGPFAGLNKRYHVEVDGIDINVYFAPEDNVEKIIYNRISKAGKSVYFMYFSFTSDQIGELLIDMHSKGLKVAGVIESRGSGSEHSEYTKLKIEGVHVKKDVNRHVMHHKVIIIDGHTVITGSYNLSGNASMKNDENLLVINSGEIARIYMEEFNRIYPGGKKWE